MNKNNFKLFYFLFFICFISSIVFINAEMGYGNSNKPTLTAPAVSTITFDNSSSGVNSSSYWGTYLYSDYNMPVIKTYAYNQSSPFYTWLASFKYDYNQTYTGGTYNSTYDRYAYNQTYTGTGMNYTNLALINQTNNFTENQIISANLSIGTSGSYSPLTIFAGKSTNLNEGLFISGGSTSGNGDTGASLSFGNRFGTDPFPTWRTASIGGVYLQSTSYGGGLTFSTNGLATLDLL